MKCEEVDACSFPSWYPHFKKSTIRSKILKIPNDVITYLKDNGTIVLPEGCLPTSNQYQDCDNEELAQDWKETNSSESKIKEPKFQHFSDEISSSIKELGGDTFPKLNWSSPKDAFWVALNNTLKCKFPGDVFLLLKSSIFVTHDVTCPYKDCDDSSNNPSEYCLVLRKWTEINPSSEFRCFVKDKKFIGICQRDPSQHYTCIKNDQKSIKSDIITFWKEKIQNRFPSNSYVFDVYRPSKDYVVLVDFNPFGTTTDTLLFTWEELRNDLKQVEISTNDDDVLLTIREEGQIESPDELSCLDNLSITEGSNNTKKCDPEFRCVVDNNGVQPNPYMQYGLPTDIVDLSTGQDPYKLIDFLQMAKNIQDQESSDEDD